MSQISSTPHQNIPKRFQSSKKVLFIDRFMTQFIKIGGIGLIAAVLGIFVFIFSQIVPLFQGATVEKSQTISIKAKEKLIGLGIDEWAEKPFAFDNKGQVYFANIKDAGKIEVVKLPTSDKYNINFVKYDEDSQSFLVGYDSGYFSLITLEFEPEYYQDQREIAYSFSESGMYPLLRDPHVSSFQMKDMDYAGESETKLIGSIIFLKNWSHSKVMVSTLIQEETLFGAGDIEIGDLFDISDQIEGEPEMIRVSEAGDGVLVLTDQGIISYFYFDGDDLILRQTFSPFEDLGPKFSVVRSIDFLSGGASIYVTNGEGENRIFSLYLDEGAEYRKFGQTKSFPKLNYGISGFAKSLLNKSFLVGSKNWASLRYATTEDVRWEASVPFEITGVALSKKYHRMLFLDDSSQLHLYKLSDPHPESGFKAFFSKVWYEGFSEPQYLWQSTGGTDSFEPKLSLIPLIIGSLKGTFYAMLFAIPLALLAGIYSSEFLDPKYKKIVKPTMEMMASLPSVILGFLAALWLAPLIEDKVPSVLSAVIAVPLIALFMGFIWSRLPVQYRTWLKPGSEWLVMSPIVILGVILAWNFGYQVEQTFFVTIDPSTGAQIADFRLWWPDITGTPFEQRNSLVVGFIMGFAVIPIIFTITDDSLSMVPKALRSASLACGASRWQTAFYIVVPTAAAGIFSGCMIGLGRAVGETMIVLMATGNTPIMDFNIFSGMRTLSANLAVELPEAPFHGTLYRTLFLGSLILFMMTFLVNTLAETLRQYLREKYKTV